MYHAARHQSVISSVKVSMNKNGTPTTQEIPGVRGRITSRELEDQGRTSLREATFLTTQLPQREAGGT